MIEVGENAHGELRLDAAGRDEVIEGVGEGKTDAVESSQYACYLPSLWAVSAYEELR